MSILYEIIGKGIFLFNPSLWLLILHPALILLLALKHKIRHPIIFSLLTSFILSWLFSIGYLLCEDVILENFIQHGSKEYLDYHYADGARNIFVGLFGWACSLFLFPFWFLVLFLPWLIHDTLKTPNTIEPKARKPKRLETCLPIPSTAGIRSKLPSSAFTENQCPLCGGITKRRWAGILGLDITLFFISLVVVIFVLDNGDSIFAGILLLFCAGVTLITLPALPVIGVMAVIEPKRCCVCDHCFHPTFHTQKEINSTRIPLRLAVIGYMTFLIALGIGWTWMISVVGGLILLAALAPGMSFLAKTLRGQMK
jgi:hypothetical protein